MITVDLTELFLKESMQNQKYKKISKPSIPKLKKKSPKQLLKKKKKYPLPK